MTPDFHDFDGVICYLQLLKEKGFWGDIELKFRGHGVTVIELHRTIKPGELSVARLT